MSYSAVYGIVAGMPVSSGRRICMVKDFEGETPAYIAIAIRTGSVAMIGYAFLGANAPAPNGAGVVRKT
jgi:hypothetical protein